MPDMIMRHITWSDAWGQTHELVFTPHDGLAELYPLMVRKNTMVRIPEHPTQTIMWDAWTEDEWIARVLPDLTFAQEVHGTLVSRWSWKGMHDHGPGWRKGTLMVRRIGKAKGPDPLAT